MGAGGKIGKLYGLFGQWVRTQDVTGSDFEGRDKVRPDLEAYSIKNGDVEHAMGLQSWKVLNQAVARQDIPGQWAKLLIYKQLHSMV